MPVAETDVAVCRDGVARCVRWGTDRTDACVLGIGKCVMARSVDLSALLDMHLCTQIVVSMYSSRHARMHGRVRAPASRAFTANLSCCKVRMSCLGCAQGR